MLYEIDVQLQAIEPPIWRRLQVPPLTSLHRLHRILQRAMGWTNSHVYLFEVEEKTYGKPSPDWNSEVMDSRKTTLEKIFSGGTVSFLYEYDLGDSWKHEITLLGTVEGEEKLGCKAGARACPPEDCGGTHGYYALLVILSDPDHERYDTMLEWVGGPFDPGVFDVAAVDRLLKRLR